MERGIMFGKNNFALLSGWFESFRLVPTFRTGWEVIRLNKTRGRATEVLNFFKYLIYNACALLSFYVNVVTRKQYTGPYQRGARGAAALGRNLPWALICFWRGENLQIKVILFAKKVHLPRAQFSHGMARTIYSRTIPLGWQHKKIF